MSTLPVLRLRGIDCFICIKDMSFSLKSLNKYFVKSGELLLTSIYGYNKGR